MSTDLNMPTRPAPHPPLATTNKPHRNRKPPVRPLRWLNTTTIQLENARAKSVANEQKYAILSHTWEDNEIDYQAFHEGRFSSESDSYRKICGTCDQARNDAIDYLWADMCCINKDSSAELSESINSMYAWYAHAAVCYVYLSDVPAQASLSGSKWFTRGWTLQELLAPRNVAFYDQNWSFLGTKETLCDDLGAVTRIDRHMLLGERTLETYSIAQRMSWAADRETTRIEDRAYSLLGLFDINMPMLYGEGEKAFLRLQEEIIKYSDDHTIFAWPIQDDDEPGLLAMDPDAFKTCSEVVTMSSRRRGSSYSITNRGLSIKLAATPFETDTYLVRLDCIDHQQSADQAVHFAFLLRRLQEDDQYARVRCGVNTFLKRDASLWSNEQRSTSRQGRPMQHLQINVRQSFRPDRQLDRMSRVHGFRIATEDLIPEDHAEQKATISPIKSWDNTNRILRMKPGDFGFAGALDIHLQGKKIRLIKLGFDFDYNPVIFLAASSGTSDATASPVIDSTSEKQAQLQSIHSRTPFDAWAWTPVVSGRARQFERHTGLWALKGDRLSGLDVELPEYGRVKIERVVLDGMLVWNVHVEDMKSAFGGKLLRRVLVN
ncbi:hypothetical protein LTR86_001224 [Recurvomyces mirabilis]|nr:hypothetical protein LTR86_001224 [Recurvomyces mirabilis]